MIKNKWWAAFFLLLFLALIQPGYGLETDEDSPVKVILQNDSDHVVLVHVLAFDMIDSTHNLESGKVLEIEAAFGNRIKLEYTPSPGETLLSRLGSLNETNRTVFIRNDGKTVFVEEKFSGQRVKGKGEKRIQPRTISEPELEREKGNPDADRRSGDLTGSKSSQGDPVTGGKSLKKKKPTRKEDPTRPEKKKEKENK